MPSPRGSTPPPCRRVASPPLPMSSPPPGARPRRIVPAHPVPRGWGVAPVRRRAAPRPRQFVAPERPPWRGSTPAVPGQTRSRVPAPPWQTREPPNRRSPAAPPGSQRLSTAGPNPILGGGSRSRGVAGSLTGLRPQTASSQPGSTPEKQSRPRRVSGRVGHVDEKASFVSDALGLGAVLRLQSEAIRPCGVLPPTPGPTGCRAAIHRSSTPAVGDATAATARRRGERSEATPAPLGHARGIEPTQLISGVGIRP